MGLYKMKKLNQANCPNLIVQVIKPQVSTEMIAVHWLGILNKISETTPKRSSKG